MRHDTNMLFIRVGDDHAAALGEFMKARGVLINASPVVRLVMHLDVNREQLAEVVKHWQAFYSAKEPHVPQRILVLGASGYIGQHLTTALSQRGHQVLAAARNTDRLQSWRCRASPATTLTSTGRRRFPRCWKRSTRFTTVHSMGEGGDFIAHERQVALNVRDALLQTPVKQVIFKFAPGA